MIGEMTEIEADVFSKLISITDVETLRRIGKAAYDKANTLREMQANCISWHTGQQVQLKTQHQGRKPYNQVGTVEKVNPKKLKVRYEGFSIWNIPKTMLQVVE